MSDIETFAFDNEDIKGGLYDKYKGVQNEVHRTGIVYTDPKALFAGSKIHYKKRFFRCKNGICCEKLGPSKWRMGAVLIKYGTDKMGGVKKPFSYELYPWLFSEQTYIKLKNVNSEYPLANHDIKISCTNEKYQHLDITPCKESIWTSKEELKKQVLIEAKPIWESIKKSIAEDLSTEEIKDLLEMSSGTGTDPSTKIDLDSVLNDV